MPKEEFIYVVLDKEQFTLTRNEVSNIVALMLDIDQKDKSAIDLDELQFSFSSYIKYYELVESRVMDLLEKFKISICKKLNTDDQVEELIQCIN